MKKLLCKIFGHKFNWEKSGWSSKSFICKRCGHDKRIIRLKNENTKI